eukprot:7704902-Ditylum_brightwellii.AAC.1
MTVNKTVEQCKTWELNGIKGWYLEPSRDHYRCYKAYIPSTKGEQVTITVDFHTATTKLSHISPAEAATQAVRNLTVALQSQPINAPFKTIGDIQLAAIKELANKLVLSQFQTFHNKPQAYLQG